MKIKDCKISIIGLGYVGLPLAIAFGSKFNTTGIDNDNKKIKKLKNFDDPTNQIGVDEFLNSSMLKFSCEFDEIKNCDVVIVTVPTPIDKKNKPDFSLLKNACESIGKHIKKNSIVVFESTVYPGATEEICIPILEKKSGFKWKKDFFVGYSPERINPGDKDHDLKSIVKVVSADNEENLIFLEKLYKKIIDAGIYKASSIKVAEAAKVIENTQRDLNIALMNELSILFNKLNIPTHEVLKAASTKWNFLNFFPGLVGGHCIGVDPYYLTHKAKSIGYDPEVILAGRKLNDNMSNYVLDQILKEFKFKNIKPSNSKILILGITFKENCNDLRNSKILDVIHNLMKKNFNLSIHDPHADLEEALNNYNINLIPWTKLEKKYDCIIFSVPHEFYLQKSLNILNKIKKGGLVFDFKSTFSKFNIENKDFEIWSL